MTDAIMKMYMFFLLAVVAVSGCDSSAKEQNKKSTLTSYQDRELDTATFAGGCFWCVEASFEQIKGVAEAVSGYAGGSASTADYKKVSSGQTKHAETVQVYYNPEVISYETLLDIFFTAHDPTQLNRQGPDVGPQYRSAIFYHNTAQKELAEQKIAELSGQYSKPIVTRLDRYSAFYPAEDYHQDYEQKHPYDPYIVNVSRPKIERVKDRFNHILKAENHD